MINSTNYYFSTLEVRMRLWNIFKKIYQVIGSKFLFIRLGEVVEPMIPEVQFLPLLSYFICFIVNNGTCRPNKTATSTSSCSCSSTCRTWESRKSRVVYTVRHLERNDGLDLFLINHKLYLARTVVSLMIMYLILTVHKSRFSTNVSFL